MKLRYRINQGMLVALVGLVSTAVYAEESATEESAVIQVGLDVVPADTLGALLKNVEERRVVESRENVQRERDLAVSALSGRAQRAPSSCPSGLTRDV